MNSRWSRSSPAEATSRQASWPASSAQGAFARRSRSAAPWTEAGPSPLRSSSRASTSRGAADPRSWRESAAKSFFSDAVPTTA